MSDAQTAVIENIERELVAIGTLVQDATHQLTKGELIDMSALDGRVTKLCAHIEAQPPETAAPLRDKVLAMIQDMTRLAKMIEVRLMGLRGNLQQGGGRQGAAAAYGVPGRTDEPKR
jgi:hypothetical protein